MLGFVYGRYTHGLTLYECCGKVWRMQGLLTFLDPPRPDTKETVRLSRVNGVAVKMITGDHLLIAMETARVLDMGDCIQSAEGLPLLDKETKAL